MYFTTHIDREIKNSKALNSLVFLESQYFYFNYSYYINSRYHLIDSIHQGVPTEKAPKRYNPTSTVQLN